MEELKIYINHFIDLHENQWETLIELFTEVRFKKGEHIYGNSDIADAIYFIVDGIVRSYKLEPDGKDFTWTFHCLNTDVLKHRMLMDVAVVDYVSFTRNVPEELAFEVLADATLLKIDKKDLYALYESDIRWQRFATKMAEDAYAVTRERTFNLLTKNAKERLEALINYFPGIFEKGVGNRHIASYLGITRQSLNRLLREM
jgi:CRP-like cAMP-binding protein